MGARVQAIVIGALAGVASYEAMAIIARLLGDRERLDLFGFALLSVIGGIVGLGALPIYNKATRSTRSNP